MIKTTITIIKDAAGNYSVAYLGDDATKAIAALKDFNGDGEVGFFRLSVPEKSKKSGKALAPAVTQESPTAPTPEPEPAAESQAFDLERIEELKAAAAGDGRQASVKAARAELEAAGIEWDQ